MNVGKYLHIELIYATNGRNPFMSNGQVPRMPCEKVQLRLEILVSAIHEYRTFEVAMITETSPMSPGRP